MSREFAQHFKGKKYKRDDVRNFTNIAIPYGEDGRPVYLTEQGHKDECDVNNIIKKYDSTGLLTHVAKFEADYADVGSMDFKDALDRQLEIGNRFMQLPSEIRKTFENNPVQYLAFLEKPENYEKSVEMGLRKPPEPKIPAPAPSKLQQAANDPPKA